jgi:hypothetical protein
MPDEKLLDRVRKLLAKAADDGVTEAEAQSLTAKATELMAKYGIDRALLAATQKIEDKPGSRIIQVDNPWARVNAHLLCGLGAALRCQAILLPSTQGSKVHMFGYQSDLERLDLLYTSLLLQQAHALVRVQVPPQAHNVRAWRRSWLLGWTQAVIERVKAAEAAAVQEVKQEARGTGAELVLADRSLVIKQSVKNSYPHTRNTRMTYSGSGYGQGHNEGKKANIGGTGIGNRRAAGALA